MSRLTVICISFIVISLMLASISDAGFDPANVVGAWLLDGDASDSSGNGNDGTLVGDPQWVDGKVGGALAFDGDDVVEAPDSDNLRLGMSQTVMAWINPTEDVGDWVRLVGKGASDPRNYGMWRQSDGDILFQIYPGCNCWEDGNAATNAPINTWTHVAGTYDGAQMKLFINGVELVAADCAAEPATSEDPLTIGFAGFHTYFIGLIDEVVVLNSVLTEDDIADIMNGIVAVSPLGKLATTWGDIKK